MAVRKHKSKKGWWEIVISKGRKGKQKVYTFQGSEAEARAFEADLRGLPPEASDCKVVDLTSRFFDWYAINRAKKSNEGLDFAFQRLLPVLGDRHMSLLHQNDYDRYKAKRLEDGVSKRTINIELVYFRAFLRWAEENHYLCGAKPTLFAKKYTKPRIPVVLARDELARLIDKLKGDKKTFARLMAWCGLRREEALTLRREDVDMANGLLRVTGKGNKTRIVPIIGEALKIDLETVCKGKERQGYLFVNKKTKQPYQNIRKALKNAADKAGIDKKIYNHLLRHTFGASAVAAGVQQRAIQDMLGHSDSRTTEIYTQIAAEFLQAEAGKMEAIFGAAPANPPQPEPEKTAKRHLRIIKK